MPNSARSQVCRSRAQVDWTGRGWKRPCRGTGLTAGLHTPALHHPAHQPWHPASPATPTMHQVTQQPCTPNLVLHTQLCTPTQSCIPSSASTLHTSSALSPAHSATYANPGIPGLHTRPHACSAHQTFLAGDGILRGGLGDPTALSTTTGHSPRKGPDPGGPRLSQASPLTPPHTDAQPGWWTGRVHGISPLSSQSESQQALPPSRASTMTRDGVARRFKGAHWAGPGSSPSSAEQPDLLTPDPLREADEARAQGRDTGRVWEGTGRCPHPERPSP